MKLRTRLIAGLAVVGLVVWGLIPAVVEYLAQRELSRFQRAGNKIKVTGRAGHRIGVSAESVEGWFPLRLQGQRANALPLSYRAENLSVSLHVPFLQPWSPTASFKGQLYGGSAVGQGARSAGGAVVDAELKRIDLSQHPQVRALGVERGYLSVAIGSHPVPPAPPRAAHYELTLEDLDLLIPPSVSEIVKIASVSSMRLVAVADVQPNGRFSVSSCSLSSSIAQGTLTASGVLSDSQTLSEASGRFRVELLGDEGQKLAQWLPLLTNQRVQGSQRTFGCTFQILPCQKLSSFDFRSGPLCGKISCGP